MIDCIPTGATTQGAARNSSSSSSPSSTKRPRIVSHSRNIRAVIFHPSGKFVFVAAPDPPIGPGPPRGPTAANRYACVPVYVCMCVLHVHDLKERKNVCLSDSSICLLLTSCRLYGFAFASLFSEPPYLELPEPILLMSLPTVLPEVTIIIHMSPLLFSHLYCLIISLFTPINK